MNVLEYGQAFLLDAQTGSGRDSVGEDTYKILSHGLKLDPNAEIFVYKEFNIEKDQVELVVYYRAMMKSGFSEEIVPYNMRTDIGLRQSDFNVAAGLSDNPEQMDAILWSWVRRDMQYDIWEMKRQNKERREHGTRFGNCS